MRHFYLSASFISIPDPVSGLKTGAYYIMWRSGKITRFWHCIFFYRFRKKFPTLRDKPLLAHRKSCADSPSLRAADIYSLGRVLTELSDAMSCRCSRQLRCILKQTCAADPADRCQEACDLKAALLRVPLSENQQSSHLIRNIAVIGSRPGAGATHISISLVSTMNQKHIPAIYIAADGSASLLHAARVNHRLIDQSGIFIYGSFRGIPDYGDSISVSVPPDDCVVRDYGTRAPALAELASFDLILFVLNGRRLGFCTGSRLWETAGTAATDTFSLQSRLPLCRKGIRTAVRPPRLLLSGRCGSIRYNTRKGTACFVHLTEERRETASSILIATKPKHTSPSAFSDVIRGLA